MTPCERRCGKPKPQCRRARQSKCQDDGKRGPRGYDGAKQIKGRKRFILVDTLGLVLGVLVTEANITERDGAEWLLNAVSDRFPRLKLAWVDGGFRGADFGERIKRLCGLAIEVVKAPDDGKTFVALAR